jgi:diketogulonate reductase-like aldo/keto reductase
VLGQGTWELGGHASRRTDEIAALRLGLDLGMTLVDTAEMYGDGDAEKLVAEAIDGRRREVFLVSKVLPSNATRQGTLTACERSLRRLRTDVIDLYLLHWRGGIPLDETVSAFDALERAGKIRYWGVSNFDGHDLDDLRELARPDHGSPVAVNQVLYNLTRRGIEHDLLPRCRSERLPIMAYSPLEQARLLGRRAIRQVAARRGVTPAQVALAWVIREEGILAIPKAGRADHVRENFGALSLELTSDDLADLDLAFPPPAAKQPLEMI